MGFMNNLKVSAKLGIMGGFAILMMVVLVVFNYSKLMSLHHGEEELSQRSKDAVRIQECAGMGAAMYRVIADAVISRDYAAIQKEWEEIKDEFKEDLAAIGAIADHPQEKEWLEKTKEHYQASVKIFESEMIPALQFSSGMTKEIQALDEKIDENITEIEEHMQQIAGSLGGEMKEAEEEFDKTMGSSITGSIVMAIIAIAITLIFVLLVTRAIVSPVSRLTEIADAVATGDLDVDVDIDSEDELGHLAGSFRSMIDALKEKADVLGAFAAGDLAKDLKLASDADGVGRAILTMRKSLSAMSEEVKHLVSSAKAGKLDVRADASQYEGDYKAIVGGINETLDAVIGPLNVTAEYVDRISKGDIPEKITDEYYGDFNEVKNNLNQLIDSLNSFTAEMQEMSRQHDLGDIDIVIPAEKFQGAYRDMADGVNKMVNGHITVNNKAMKCVEEFGNGNFDAELEKFPGKKAIINETIEEVRRNLKNFVKEVDALVTASVDGRINERADAGHYQGDYRKMVDGVNNIMNSLVGHLNAVPAPVMIIDKEFTVQYLNRSGAQAVGSTMEGVVGKKCYSLFKTSHCQTGDCALHRAMAENREVTAETDAHPNGLDLEISYTGLPLKNRDGVVIGALEVVTDQTAIKQAARIAEKINDFQGDEVEKLTRQLNRFAEGDLTASLTISEGDADTADTREKFIIIAEAFNRSVNGLKSIIAEIMQSSDSVVSASEELSATAQQISKGAENQASSLEETSSSITQMSATIQETGKNVENQSSAMTQMASSIEEMSQSINEVARNAQEVNKIAEEAAKIARSGGDSVGKTVEGMNRINQIVAQLSQVIDGLGTRSEEIGNIVNTINDIAEQTNLLALNAAIEAARAGEHGKGFAVVADEVRKLAERSQMSTKDIAQLIKGIQEDTGSAVKTTQESARSVQEGIDLAREAGEAIKQIISSVDNTNNLAGEISSATDQQAKGSEQIVSTVNQVSRITEQVSSATEEQSAGSEQIVHAVENVNKITQQNSAAAEEMANSTSQLAKLAESLRQMVGKFKLEDGKSEAVLEKAA